jgi:hypothetical protein
MGGREICFAVAVVVVVVVVDHDVGAAARAQFTGAVASAVAVTLLMSSEDQFFSGFGKQEEKNESSEDENPDQGSELPGERDQNQSCHLLKITTNFMTTRINCLQCVSPIWAS